MVTSPNWQMLFQFEFAVTKRISSATIHIFCMLKVRSDSGAAALGYRYLWNVCLWLKHDPREPPFWP
jgi:hypothetical protein